QQKQQRKQEAERQQVEHGQIRDRPLDDHEARAPDQGREQERGARAEADVRHDERSRGVGAAPRGRPAAGRHLLPANQGGHGGPPLRQVGVFYSPANAPSTCSSWPSTETFFQTLRTMPAASIRNVERWMPIETLPYMFFSRRAPYESATA